jgi:serine-type D-Ala-D-Ala carboxypeptidase/endopeptidase (penicillin-binding protein 4)
VPDPVFFAADMLGQGLNLTGQGLSLAQFNKKYGTDYREKHLLLAWESPRLIDIIKETNHESINLYADAILKRTAKEAGFGTDFKQAATYLKNYWQTLPGFEPKDGSGLSMAGRVTAASMTDILAKAAATNIDKTLPVLGQSGTLKNLGRNSKAAGRIYAKSGSIEGTRSYAGYYNNKEGVKMAFCFILAQYSPGAEKEVRKTLEQLMINLVE